jgi:hypothetical protein
MQAGDDGDTSRYSLVTLRYGEDHTNTATDKSLIIIIGDGLSIIVESSKDWGWAIRLDTVTGSA